MEKMLITGATGFLGSRIKDYYKNQYEICTPSHREMEITDEDAVRMVFKREQPDLVIHCAAVSDTGKCEREPELSWKVNVDGCRNIAKAANDIGAKCLICSSDQVYFGSDIMEPHSEDEKLLPANLYGREKLQAEAECLNVNSDCVLLRLTWMYDTKSRSLHEHGDFMRTLLAKLDTDEILSYPIYDVRGITDVKEVIKNLQKAFALPGGVYNFGSPNEDSTYKTVEKLFEELGLCLERIQKNEVSFKEKPRNLAMSQKKLNSYGIEFSSTAEGLLRNLRKFIFFHEKTKI